MPFTMITLDTGGGYRRADGTVPRAQLRATPLVPMVNGTTTVAQDVVIPLDAGGRAARSIAATTDPGTLPAGNAYRFRIDVDGHTVHRFIAAVPHNTGSVVDVANLVELEEPPDLVPGGGGGGVSYTDEQVRDVVAAMLVQGANVTITPNDGADTITIASSGGGGGGGGSSDLHTIYSASPPFPLAALPGSGNVIPTVQAHLNYLDTTYGGGRVVLPAGRTLECNSALVVPNPVTLEQGPGGVLDFSAAPTNVVAITITGTDYAPLRGITMIGPQSGRLLTDTSVGIKVTAGVRLRFYDCKIRHFGRGVDWAASETWLCTMVGGAIEECGTCVYGANADAGATNAGENMRLENVTLYNSRRAINASGNGVSFFLDGCSLDYCTEMGRISDAWVYFDNCHIESNGANSPFGYFFEVTNNSKVSMQNTDVIMGAGGATPLAFLFKPTEAPFNFGNGRALFSGVKIYAQKPSGGDTLWHSEGAFVWPGGQASKVEFTPFPIRWCPVSAQLVAQDFFTQGTEAIRVTAMPDNGAAGLFELTATPTPPDARMIRVKLG